MAKLKLDFPEGFFEPETRCGYEVTAEMKKVWAVELDLLSELLRVCDKHGLKVFASGGTLLGAVRHQGFIPWDDDIDMMMFREDYDRLCEVAPEEFTSPYFFQTEYTDPGYLTGHAKLRHSDTTALRKDCVRYCWSFNQSIFLDIFPLDNVVDDERLYRKQEKSALFWRMMYYVAADFSTRAPVQFTDMLWKNLVYILNPPFHGFVTRHQLEDKAYRRFDSICQMHNDRETELVSTLTFRIEIRQHWKRRADFEKIVYLPFEFLEIPVGSGYEDALDRRYGNWHEFVKGTSMHGEILFDTERPYTEYLAKYRAEAAARKKR